jgi:hypothetical protein
MGTFDEKLSNFPFKSIIRSEKVNQNPGFSKINIKKMRSK